MATRRQFEARCASLGCTIEDDGDGLRVVAPQGKLLAYAGGVHETALYTRGRGEWRAADLYDALLEDLAEGLEDCEDPDCSCCPK